MEIPAPATKYSSTHSCRTTTTPHCRTTTSPHCKFKFMMPGRMASSHRTRGGRTARRKQKCCKKTSLNLLRQLRTTINWEHSHGRQQHDTLMHFRRLTTDKIHTYRVRYLHRITVMNKYCSSPTIIITILLPKPALARPTWLPI